MAKQLNLLPHEILFNRRDVPGEHIPMAYLIIDMQAMVFYSEELGANRTEG